MEEATAPNLTERLAEALRLVDLAIQDASQQLQSQPDNPAIHRVSDRVSAFVLPLSEMTMRTRRAGEVGGPPGSRGPRTSWSPFDHDWLAQVRYARELLELRRFSALRALLSGGGYRDPSHGFRTFAPEVIENISRITGDLRAAVEMTDSRRMRDPDEATAVREGGDTSEPRQLVEPSRRRNRM